MIKNYKKQTDIKNFTELFSGYLDEFISEHDFDHNPVAYLNQEKQDVGNFGIVWRSDILIDADYNLLLPTYYVINNYKDKSYSDSETGHNTVSDVDFDVDVEYGSEYVKVDFQTVIKPAILEMMRGDDYPEYNEYVNLMTVNKN